MSTPNNVVRLQVQRRTNADALEPPMVPPSRLAIVAGVCLVVAVVGLLWLYSMDVGTP